MARKDIPTKYTRVYYDEKTDSYFYKLSYIDILGTKKYETKRGFKFSPKEAYEAKIARKKELEGVSTNSFCYITIDKLYEEFIATKALKLKKSSLRVFTKTLTNNVLPFFKNKLVDKINITDITKWQKYILKLNYKYSYNKTIYTCFNQLLNFGVKYLNIKTNILSKIGAFKNDKIITKNANVWSVEDFSKFIAVIDELEWKIFYSLLFLTGLRRGESQALRWSDIDFNTAEINVNKTFNGKDEKNNLIVTTPKTTNSNRFVSMPTPLVTLLKELKNQHKKYPDFSDNKFVFGFLEPFPKTTIEARKNRYCKQSGVKQIRIHDFRHSHVSMLLQITAPTRIPFPVIAKRLGHTIEVMLNIYAHMLPNDQIMATKGIEEKLKSLILQ